MSTPLSSFSIRPIHRDACSSCPPAHLRQQHLSIFALFCVFVPPSFCSFPFGIPIVFALLPHTRLILLCLSCTGASSISFVATSSPAHHPHESTIVTVSEDILVSWATSKLQTRPPQQSKYLAPPKLVISGTQGPGHTRILFVYVRTIDIGRFLSLHDSSDQQSEPHTLPALGPESNIIV